MEQSIALERKFCADNYAPLPVVLHSGAGAWLTDIHGKRYLDLMSAYSATNFGHGHSRLLTALIAQAQTLAMVSRAYYAGGRRPGPACASAGRHADGQAARCGTLPSARYGAVDC